MKSDLIILVTIRNEDGHWTHVRALSTMTQRLLGLHGLSHIAVTELKSLHQEGGEKV